MSKNSSICTRTLPLTFSRCVMSRFHKEAFLAGPFDSKIDSSFSQMSRAVMQFFTCLSSTSLIARYRSAFAFSSSSFHAVTASALFAVSSGFAFRPVTYGHVLFLTITAWIRIFHVS
ncbi:PREDICTED: uncharacterized protein LOC105452913 [Wasmannia auropunctata]|uniref:uncharacterized protein LOC105452913 n=1 Tax=Wasmannia auropunctata TaxID=64793 RepID=UPI0005EE5DEE|nr:PREDICTED: uncharacterized protein LOC105452913 [Wasmannia auropunctata]